MANVQAVAMMRVVELINLYLRSQSRPKNLALFLIFDYQLQVLRKFMPLPNLHHVLRLGSRNSKDGVVAR